MLKLACLLGWAILALAQDPAALFEKAPPDIDEALRARVTKFYQAHVERKFRAADEMVAEDSKDIFFGMEKQTCRSFGIMKVAYSESFSRAVVVIACDTDLVMPMGGGRFPVKMPLRSMWKTVEGQWFWYADPPGDKEIQTPFGTHKPSPPDAGAAFQGKPGATVDLESVMRMVNADKEQITLDAAAVSSDQIVISNQMPGSVTLAFETTPIPGLEFKFDRTRLSQNESATLSVRYQPSAESAAPRTVKARVVILPLDQEIPVTITFRQSPPAARGN
jgi:hypothetical protein